MSERKWREINVYFDNGESVSIRRSDFDELKEIRPILDTLLHVKRMHHDVNRLLGEAKE